MVRLCGAVKFIFCCYNKIPDTGGIVNKEVYFGSWILDRRFKSLAPASGRQATRCRNKTKRCSVPRLYNNFRTNTALQEITH